LQPDVMLKILIRSFAFVMYVVAYCMIM